MLWILFMAERVMRKERHVRWNWEQSPDNPDLVRYHFVVVDDRDREGIMARIIGQLQMSGPLDLIRRVEGGVGGSKLRYLFESYDCSAGSKMIDWNKVGKKIRDDERLKERVRGDIVDYVAKLYEHRK